MEIQVARKDSCVTLSLYRCYALTKQFIKITMNLIIQIQFQTHFTMYTNSIKHTKNNYYALFRSRYQGYYNHSQSYSSTLVCVVL